MVLLELFLSFVKIGFSSFGGVSMIPQISSEMLSHGWMTAEEVVDIVAIAEVTPGPLGLNCATFAGMNAAGIPGAVAANLGVLVPTMTLCALAAAFLERFKNSRRLEQSMIGVRPATFGMIIGLAVSLGLETYAADMTVRWDGLAIAAAALVMQLKFRLSVPKTLFASAGLGVLLFAVRNGTLL